MVCADDDGPSQEVLPLLFHPTPHAKEFLASDAVTPSHIRQTVTGISDDVQLTVRLLLEYSAESRIRGISIEDVLSIITRMHKDRCRGKPILELKNHGMASLQSLLQLNFTSFQTVLCSSLAIRAKFCTKV